MFNAHTNTWDTQPMLKSVFYMTRDGSIACGNLVHAITTLRRTRRVTHRANIIEAEVKCTNISKSCKMRVTHKCAVKSNACVHVTPR